MDDLLPIASLIAFAILPIGVPFLLFGLLEQRFPGGPVKPATGWLFNIKLLLLYLAVPTLFGGLMAGLVAMIRAANGGGVLDLDLSSGSGWAATAGAILAYLFVWDFFYYWWHRAQHESRILWAIHELHHRDESLNVTTQMRVHWLEEIGRIPFMFVPMALLFNLPIAGGVTAVALTFWSGFIHANLRLPLGPLSMVIAGPQVHRIHHSRLSQHFDRNYAAFFPVFDVVFGTYYHPARDEFPPTGIAGAGELPSVWAAATLPFRNWRAMMRPQRREADL